jgi:uncharacterized protein (TIGR02266 family)
MLASILHLSRSMERRASDSERPTLPCPREPEPEPEQTEPRAERENVRESGRVMLGERRSFFRVRTELEISIEADSHAFTATSVNLCPGGLLVSTYRALPRGLVVSVEFDLPASRVVAQAAVSWSREAGEGKIPGYGFAFTELTRFDRTLIESYCARLAPEAYPRLAPVRSGFPLASFDRRLAG